MKSVYNAILHFIINILIYGGVVHAQNEIPAFINRLDQKVYATAEAQVNDGEYLIARDDAIKLAKETALQNKVTQILGSDIFTSFEMLIKQQILSRTGDYLKQIEIVNEGSNEEKKLYKVEINGDIDNYSQFMLEIWGIVSQQFPQLASSSLIIIVREYEKKERFTRELSSFTTSSELDACFTREGFRVLDKEFANEILNLNLLRSEPFFESDLESNPELQYQILKAVKQKQSRFLLLGTVTLVKLSDTGDRKIARVSGSFRLLDAYSGNLISLFQQDHSGAGSTLEGAIQTAGKRLANAAFQNMIPGLVRTLIRSSTNKKSFDVTVNNLTDYGTQATSLLKVVRGLGGKVKIFDESYEGEKKLLSFNFSLENSLQIDVVSLLLERAKAIAVLAGFRLLSRSDKKLIFVITQN